MKRWAKRLLIGTFATLAGLLLLLTGLYLYLDRTNGELTSSGEKRKYLLYVPASYQAGNRTPLVISLHGAWWYPAMQQRLTLWSKVADQQGFIVVYPRATGFPRTWGVAPGPRLEKEQRFFTTLIDKLSAQYSIDPDRIYVSGYSNGAAMTFMLSCTLADRVAAFGMVATPVVPWSWCKDTRPAPMLAFHGTADPYAPYAGGTNFLTTEPLQSLESWLARWGERNRCGSGPVTTEPAAGVTLRDYAACADGTAARLYTVHGAGHIWPGGRKLPEFGTGKYSAAVNATEEMWAFFQNHPLRGRGAD